MSHIDPGTLAAIDQERAALETHLDILIETFKETTAHRGAAQGAADDVAFLRIEYAPVELSALLMTAIARLVSQEASR